MCLNGSYRALVAFWFRCFFIVLFLAHFGFRFFRFTASTATTSATCCCCDFLLFRLVAEIFIRCWRWFFFFGCWTTATSTATCTARSTTSSKPCTFLSGIRITRTTRWIVLYWKIFYLVPTQISLDKIQFHLKNQFKWLKKNDFRLNFFKNHFFWNLRPNRYPTHLFGVWLVFLPLLFLHHQNCWNIRHMPKYPL